MRTEPPHIPGPGPGIAHELAAYAWARNNPRQPCPDDGKPAKVRPPKPEPIRGPGGAVWPRKAFRRVWAAIEYLRQHGSITPQQLSLYCGAETKDCYKAMGSMEGMALVFKSRAGPWVFRAGIADWIASREGAK